MDLPIVPLPTDTVEINGQKLQIRSLTRSQALKLSKLQGDEDAAEVLLIAGGMDVSEEVAIAWRDSTDPITVGVLITAIINVTGLGTSDPN